MSLDKIIEISERINFVEKNRNIKIPSFTFSGITCKNVDFVFMGFAQSVENKGKAIYMSKDCLPNVKLTMDFLLAGSTNGDVGTGTIGIEAANSLDSALFAITNRHLQEYTRTYDEKTHTEKIFFPLECEVFGKNHYAWDTATLNKYPQWEGFKESLYSKIKYINFKSYKRETWYWWEANKSNSSNYFCNVDCYGDPYRCCSDHKYLGCILAFCI